MDWEGDGSATLYLGSRVDRAGLTIRPLGWLIEVTRITYILNDLHGTGKRGPTKERFVVPCKVMPTLPEEPQVN
jgi:hypothetical protein